MPEEMLDKCDSSPVDYEKGMECLNGGDIDAAVRFFLSGADKYEPNALCALGICYYEGSKT